MSRGITVYVAKQIVTMNPANPTGTHVAVQDGRILGVGALDELTGWGEYELDETLAAHVLVPGMIEVHSHVLEGLTGVFPYQGYFDRPAPDGRMLRGIRSIEDLLADLRRLDQELADPDEPLLTVGFDPVYFAGARLDRTLLDTVSPTRPIFLFHANAHLATVNSAMLARHDITRDTPGTGVVKGPDGEPTGELQELPAMALARSALARITAAMGDAETIWNLGRMARQVGVTCVGDMAGGVLDHPSALAAWQRVVNDADFPARVTIHNLPSPAGDGRADFTAAAQAIQELQRSASSPKLRFPGVKFVLDGSIQGFTAVMNWPGYFHGEDHGQLLVAPEQFVDWARPFHAAGITMHIHCNGSATIDLAIDTVETLLRETAWLDHRHTVQHSQLTTAAQFRRMRALGMCANIFANHLWYWGDIHHDTTVGAERAKGMEPCATAKRIGVPFALHSDASVTPLGGLHVMWCAVNRRTASGRVLGEHERISAYDALQAVTVDAAFQMHLDHELGTIECGKWADFTVLEESPLDVDPLRIKDIGVWGTVVGGVKYPAAGAPAG